MSHKGKARVVRTVSIGDVGVEQNPSRLPTGGNGMDSSVNPPNTANHQREREQQHAAVPRKDLYELETAKSDIERGQQMLVTNYVLGNTQHSVLSTTSDQLESVQESPSPAAPQQAAPQQQQVLPGAFPQRPGWREAGSSSLQEGMSWGGSESISPLPVTEDNTGLVEASPVVLPTETAEPVDNARELDETGKTNKQVLISALAVGLCILLVTVVVLVVVLVDKGGNSSSTTSEKPLASATNGTLEENLPWEWDLPFSVPNDTLVAIQTEQMTEHGHMPSPQYWAYQWMKKDPYLDSYSVDRLKQRFALTTFYYATKGEQWEHQGGETIEFTVKRTDGLVTVHLESQPWLSYEHSECEWLSMASEDARVGRPSCRDGSNTLVNIALVNGLQGTLPEELFWLTSLEIVDIPRNSIGGTISSSIGKLTNLWKLAIHKNRISGLVPSEVGLLSKSLTWLGLMENPLLTGTLPTEFWHLSNLKYLKLKDTGLSGTLPEDLGVLTPKLQQLGLSRCNFSGKLPSSLGLLTKLAELAIHDNQFTSSLPSELGLATDLQKLFVPGNHLTGTLPSELSQIQAINLQDNVGLTGTLPSEWTSAYVVKLEGTSITGTIPPGLCGIKELLFDCTPTLCGCTCPCHNLTTPP